MKVTLVHDYLYNYGGAERVLEALHEIWPEAPVYTAWADWQWIGENRPDWLKWKIIPSWFQKIPFHKQICSPLRMLAPWIWESFDLRSYDLVISSSAWYISKGVLTSTKTTHFCYCHTPPRYLYGLPESIERKSFFIRFYAQIVNPFMKKYDQVTSGRVDWFIANSINVQQRIKKFYGRESEVIYPPIKAKGKMLKAKSKKENYYLMVNRLVWHKRVDLAIEACKKLNLALKIVGEGPLKNQLVNSAKGYDNIEFLGYVTDEKLNILYRDCQAVLYLAEEEDFGITPVEAMSFGKPVIALKSGGIQETVIEGKTGFFINKPELSELIKVLKLFNDLNHRIIKPEDCFKQAERFSQERFKKEIEEFVKSKRHCEDPGVHRETK